MFDQIEKSYGKYFDPPKDSFSADEYAIQFVKSIENDDKVLLPKGLTRWGLAISRHAPRLYQKLTMSTYQRPKGAKLE